MRATSEIDWHACECLVWINSKCCGGQLTFMKVCIGLHRAYFVRTAMIHHVTRGQMPESGGLSGQHQLQTGGRQWQQALPQLQQLSEEKQQLNAVVEGHKKQAGV